MARARIDLRAAGIKQCSCAVKPGCRDRATRFGSRQAADRQRSRPTPTPTPTIPTLLIAPGPDPYLVRIERCTLLGLIRARLDGTRLDRRLARGASPDACAELSLRAHSLHSSRSRRQLARSWRRLLSAAAAPSHPFDARVPLARLEIRRAADLIEELAELLESAEPLDASGLARVRLLLSAADSPVYAHAEADLEAALQTLIDDVTAVYGVSGTICE